jgi:hypothetical protein
MDFYIARFFIFAEYPANSAGTEIHKPVTVFAMKPVMMCFSLTGGGVVPFGSVFSAMEDEGFRPALLLKIMEGAVNGSRIKGVPARRLHRGRG